MSTTFETMDSLSAFLDKGKSGAPQERQVVNYFKIDDGETLTVRFMNELSADALNYDEDRGTAKLLQTMVNPEDFRREAVCTKEMEEDNFQCYGTQQGWKPKVKLLINVAVERNGEWEMAVLKTGPYGGIGQDIISFAQAYGSITDKTYKITRTGKRLETRYNVVPFEREPEPDAVQSLDLFDLDDIIPHVPYDRQKKFFTGEDNEESSSSW